MRLISTLVPERLSHGATRFGRARIEALLLLVGLFEPVAQEPAMRTVNCRAALPLVKATRGIGSDHACSLALASVALARRSFPDVLPGALAPSEIVEVDVRSRRLVEVGGKTRSSSWLVGLATTKEAFDVEVEFSRTEPSVVVRAVHKPLVRSRPPGGS